MYGTGKEGQAKVQTPASLRARKGGVPIACLTAYSAPFARLFDPWVDLLLVGDSLGMVLYGEETTLGVPLSRMIDHGRAVARVARHACVLVDLPFGSYQESPVQAFRTSARVLAETGAAGVKLEGGREMAETIGFLTQRGVPVLGHVGLKPQSVRQLGGYRALGRAAAEGEDILADARAVEAAGAFALVLEATIEPLARQVVEAVTIPVIGIGASPACDGQILVAEDMLGLTGGRLPRFVKPYASLAPLVEEAVKRYVEEVRARAFPGPDQVYDG